MKYSEKHSKWIYDWPTIINDLEAGLYSKQGTAECRFAAFSWTTCAFGNQCDLLPRDEGGKPKDLALRMLGTNFSAHIEGIICSKGANRQDIAADARETLAAIEARSAELLAAMKAE